MPSSQLWSSEFCAESDRSGPDATLCVRNMLSHGNGGVMSVRIELLRLAYDEDANVIPFVTRAKARFTQWTRGPPLSTLAVLPSERAAPECGPAVQLL